MGCSQVHFDVAIVDNHSVEDTPKRITFTKPVAVHILLQDPCTAPLNICIKRVVKCQKGCAFQELLHDFPIDACDPILPPGEYEISIPKTFTPLFEGVGVTVDVVFEEVSPEYIQIVAANKSGGCS